MKTITILSTFLILILSSCNEDINANIDTNETNNSTTYNRQAIPGIGTTWYLGRSCVLPSSDCFAIGSCAPIDFPSDLFPFGNYENIQGTKVLFSLISDSELLVEIQSEPITLEQIQDILDANPETNSSVEEIYNTMTSSVIVEEGLSLGWELSQQLSPNSNEVTIVPGDYPINYSNSVLGEFIVSVEQQ